MAAERKLAEAKAVEDRKRKAALLAKRKMQEQEKRAAALRAKRASELYSALSIPENNNSYVLWERESENASNRTELNADYLNLANMRAWDNVNKRLNLMQSQSKSIRPPIFVDPNLERGEFEKTADFEKQKVEYRKQLSNIEENYGATIERINDIFNEEFLKALVHDFGKPNLSLKYDADKELYNVSIQAGLMANYSASGLLQVPIASAEKMKNELKQSQPYVVYKMDQSQLRIQRIILNTSKKIYLIDGVSDNIGAFKFTEEAANTYRHKYQLALKEAQEEKNRKQAEIDRKSREARLAQQKQNAKRRAERVKKYGHPGPFLQAGSAACLEYSSMYKTMVVLRHNPYVSVPADCVESTPDILAITNVTHMNGGLSKVVIKNTGAAFYVATSTIID